MKKSLILAFSLTSLTLSACQEDFAVNDVYEVCGGITCGGHGECIPTSAISAICMCEEGYHHPEDSILDCVAQTNACQDVTCSDHGTCLLTPEGEAVCVCDDGYQNGDANTCVTTDDPCADIDCGGNGLCLVTSAGTPACLCNTGYHATAEAPTQCVQDAKSPCANIDCGGNGLCLVNAQNEPVCLCNKGYENDATNPLICLEPIDPCEGITCSGHGTCIVKDDGTPFCECDPNYDNTSDRRVTRAQTTLTATTCATPSKRHPTKAKIAPKRTMTAVPPAFATASSIISVRQNVPTTVSVSATITSAEATDAVRPKSSNLSGKFLLMAQRSISLAAIMPKSATQKPVTTPSTGATALPIPSIPAKESFRTRMN